MRPGKYQGRPILLKLLFPVTLLIVLVVLLAFGAIFSSGMMGELDQNASDILYEKVLNRKNHLENEMFKHWSQITLTAGQVNLVTQTLLESGQVDLNSLVNDPKSCSALIRELSPTLISTLRSNGVNGVFLVLNTENLSLSTGAGAAHSKQGFYIRDLDATSAPSYRNADLLLLCSPSDIVRDLSISTDTAWNTHFDFSESGYYSFFYEPFMAAYHNMQEGRHLSLLDYGYWSSLYRLPGDSRSSISFSVPLILPDGTVYGVLGVEVLQDALYAMFPYNEVAENRMGTYTLSTSVADDLTFRPVLVNGYLASSTEDVIQLAPSPGANTPEYTTTSGSETFFCSVEYLKLYNSNTPFVDQRWAVIGIVRPQELFDVSLHATTILLVTLVLALAVGLFGSVAVSWVFSRPISALSHEMRGVNPAHGVQLNRTSIMEIDQLITSVEVLSKSIIDSANKFSRIIEMASIKIAGFEVSDADNSVFITNNFFELLGRKPEDMSNLTPDLLRSFIRQFDPYITYREEETGQTVYKIPWNSGYTYIRLSRTEGEQSVFGIFEDVTKELLEMEKIEHERDHDVLTSLMNRRAFERTMQTLFEQEPESLKTAALVMLDLDNLKHFNDSYGHEAGDLYIRAAAQCFLQHTPPGTVLSRMAGDEFCIFFYGYETKSQIRSEITRLRRAAENYIVSIPEAGDHPLGLSAGAAWYPDDADTPDLLLKYADFAMYSVKRSEKNGFAEFSMKPFRQDQIAQQQRGDLQRMLEQNLISYYFQPIVHTVTGQVIGYEALMKPEVPSLSKPQDVLALARREQRLHEIERLTWTNVLHTFANHVQAGTLAPDCKIFINSIASQVLAPEVILELERQYMPYMSNIVLELIECDAVPDQLLDAKLKKVKEWGGEIALDGYGSGRNSETMLLRVNPKYIKVDMAIIRDTDTNIDKQKLIKNIVSYAHERDIIVIAEGVETEQEYQSIAEMQVDCVQGFYISPPSVNLPQP